MGLETPGSSGRGIWLSARGACDLCSLLAPLPFGPDGRLLSKPSNLGPVREHGGIPRFDAEAAQEMLNSAHSKCVHATIPCLLDIHTACERQRPHQQGLQLTSAARRYAGCWCAVWRW